MTREIPQEVQSILIDYDPAVPAVTTDALRAFWLPHLGAIRVYVGLEGDWKQVVSYLAAKASYVLLQIGASDGLMWEVEYVVNNVRPEQLILCLPNPRIKITRLSGPKKREINRQKMYQAFRSKTLGFFPTPLPEEIGGG